MKRLLCLLMVIASISVLLIACSSKNEATSIDEQEVKTFSSEDAALASAKKESPEIQRVIGGTNFVNNEKIVVYLTKTENGEGVGTASVTDENGKVSWVQNGATAIIKHKDGNGAEVKGDITSLSGKKYTLYAGVVEDPNMTINTTLENDVKPHIDKESNVYYYVEAKPGKK